MKTVCAAVLSFFWLVDAACTSRAEGLNKDRDLLEQARAGNCASRDLISSLTCNVEVSISTPSAQTQKIVAEYHRSPDLIRLKYAAHGSNREVLVRDMKETIIVSKDNVTGKALAKTATIRRYSGGFLGPPDLWPLSLMTVQGPEVGTLATFDELLTKPHKIRKVSRVGEGDQAVICVELTHRSADLLISFSARHNYLISRVEASAGAAYGESGPVRVESEVLSFKEAAPSLYFPERVQSQVFRSGKLMMTRLTVVSNIRVNTPLSPARAALLPPNSRVFDEIEEKEYDTDGSGNPKGPVTALNRVPGLPKGASPEPATDSAATHWTWIWGPALLIVACVAGWWVFRSRRAQTVK